jgi:tungstate transport system substrate-binding protein
LVVKKLSVSSLILASLVALLLVSPACVSRETLRLATTTSLYDTGLWDYLKPMFEEKYGVELDIIYAGSGKALEWGRRGDVDILAVHDKAAELRFVADGYGVERVPFAYNYFLIVGPEEDPAGIKDISPEDAFKRLMEAGKANPQQVKFVSRGDNSGTHVREKTIWSAAGYSYEDVRKSGTWYVEGGNGMGPTLVMADEIKAYTLSDTGTFLAFKKELGLVPLVDEGDILLNVYSATVVSKTKNKAVANNLVEFLTSEEIQDLIGRYGVEEYGRPLFIPCAGQDL